MSSEVVKKRGRPKKVVPVSIESEKSPSAKKAIVRQKSTKAPSPPSTNAVNEPAETLSTISKRLRVAPVPEPSLPSATIPQNASSAVSTSPPNSMSGAKSATGKSTPQSLPAKVTLTNSKILDQVRALSSKAAPVSKPTGAKKSTPIPKSPTSKPPTSTGQPTTGAKSTLSSTNIASAPLTAQKPSKTSIASIHKPTQSIPIPIPPNSALPSPSSTIPSPAKSIPIAALNSTIVSQISSRAGARPSSKPPGDLPPNYRPIARKVTMTIVALPIAIVTSWVLWNRLVLGEERKELIRPGMVMVDEKPKIDENSIPPKVT